MERRISAGILAGGKSKRMGEDKARLWHGGETFLAHLLRELREFDEVLLSVEDRRAWADAPCRVVEDQLPDFGPVEGIYQLLRAARNPYVLVNASFQQCLTALALQTLAGQIRPGLAGTRGWSRFAAFITKMRCRCWNRCVRQGYAGPVRCLIVCPPDISSLPTWDGTTAW